jgi:predicted Zn-dependent peptidase
VHSHRISTRPNGLTVVTVSRPFQTAFVGVFNCVGARNETEAENGISHFLEHMAFKGTTSRSPKDIVFEVEKLGSDINAFTSKNMTAYHIAGLPQHVGRSLDILADIMLNPTMPLDEIAREKEVVIEEIHESEDNIHDIAMNALMATAFPNQPGGREVLGTIENVESFTRDILLDYMHRHYHANNMIIVGVGPLDHDEFVTMVAERFDALEGRQKIQPEPIKYVGGQTVIRDERFDQTHVFIGYQAPGAYDKNFARYEMLSEVLGTGMSSPLFQTVREEKALCYSIQSGTMQGRETSLFIIAGSCSPEKLDPFINTSYGELVKIANGELSDDDFNRARNQSRIQKLSILDKPMLLACQIVEGIFYNDGVLISPEESIAIYEAVTKEDIIAAAKALIATQSTVVVVGNAEEKDYSLAA